MIAKMIVVIMITQPYRNERLKAYNTLLDIHKLHKTFKFTKKNGDKYESTMVCNTYQLYYNVKLIQTIPLKL